MLSDSEEESTIWLPVKRISQSNDSKARQDLQHTALDWASVAGVVDAAILRSGGSSDEDGHGGSGEESELGEHLCKE